MAPSECKRVLIANRGEIACRIARTCRTMGIYSIGVFSDADRFSSHCTTVDEAVHIGAAEPSLSYLSIDAIIAACKRTGADAVHPGYGFLSENYLFADRLKKEGITFIGPSAPAMQMVGDKIAAKKLALSLKVPLVPDAECDLSDKGARAHLASLLKKIGYPVVIKAAAGGGGRGMRVVRQEAELETLLASASREAEASFGDGRVFIEKYVSPARHVEVQFFGDSHGNAVTFFERDCTLQRRHQKVVEEAPAVGIPDTTRQGIHQAAKALAIGAKYSGAGTAEFLVSPSGEFYFLEVNSRLQVEHPVTEAITGLDLVALQIRIARGEKLSEIETLKGVTSPQGHAIEVRLCAEVPEEGFRASTGRVTAAHFPSGPSIRVDTWIDSRSTITHFYDSLIGKIIIHAESREAARTILATVLRTTVIGGVKTNLSYLSRLVESPEFESHSHTLQTAEEIARSLTPLSEHILPAALARIALELLPHSESDVLAWRLRGVHSPQIVLRALNERWTVSVLPSSIRTRFSCQVSSAQGSTHRGTLELLGDSDGLYYFSWNDTRLSAAILRQGNQWWMNLHGNTLHCEPDTLSIREHHTTTDAHGGGAIVSPLPGKIVEIKVKNSSTVQVGAPLIVLESMKMEHIVTAPRDGTVGALSIKVGDVVDAGKILLELL